MIKTFKEFLLEKHDWTELPKGNDVIKVIQPKNKNYVVKLTENRNAADVAFILLNQKENTFVANILQVHKIRGKKQYFIVEELVEPLNNIELIKYTKNILELVKDKSQKIWNTYKNSKIGILDLLFELCKNNIPIEHEIVYAYCPIFQWIKYILNINEIDLNSKNMAKKKNKYILFDITASVKKQEIQEINVPKELKTLDDIFEWYLKTQIR